MPVVASLFNSTGRGTVGKVGLGAGRRYQEGKGRKRGKELNTTQHNENRSHQSTATSTCTCMWKPRDTQLYTENIHPLVIYSRTYT